MTPRYSIDDIQNLDQASLAALVQDLQQSKTALEGRQFIEASLARFADLMRWRADDTLKAWVDRLLDELMTTVNGLHATLYMVESDPNGYTYLSLMGSYAYNPEGELERVEFGEGLIGQIAKSRKGIYINDSSLISVQTQSGLSGLVPAVLKIEPLVYNDSLEGVLELSAAEAFPEHVRDLLRQLTGGIAANLLTIRNQEQTQRLYREMQANAEQLASHEEEMRRNINTMKATQEELERVKNEIELKQRQMERIAANVPGMLFQYQYNLATLEEGYTFVSERSRNILFIAPADVLQSNNVVSDRVHKEDKANFSDAFRQSREKLIPLSWAGRIIAPDGSYRWIRAEATPTQTHEYLIVWDGYLYDITSEQEQEQEQQKQQQRLRLAANLADLGFLEIDLDSDTITFSQELTRIFKLSENATFNDFILKIHSDDRLLVESAIDEIRNSYQEFEIEFRLHTQDDKQCWVKSSGKILVDERQTPERALCITQDITQQKLRALEIEEKNKTLSIQEEEMRNSLEQIETKQKQINELLERQGLLFESSRDAIWIFKDGTTEDCNPAFISLYGFDSKEEALMVTVEQLLPELQPNGESSIRIFEKMVEEAFQQGSALYEWKNIQKNGVLFDAEILLSHFVFKGGKYLQATIRNISDRKQQQVESQRRQMQMELAEKLGKLGAFEISNNTFEITWSKSLKDILDLNYRKVDTLEQWRELVYEDDLAQFDACIGDTLNGKVATHSSDFRVLLQDGSYKWLQVNVAGTYNESWELTGLEGMCQDVAQAKERENLITQTNAELAERESQMRQSLEKLSQAQRDLQIVSDRQQLLFETARDAIFIMEGSKITECNPSAVKMFDVPNKEFLIHRDLQDLSPENQPNGAISKLVIGDYIQQGLVGIGSKLEWIASTYKGDQFYVEVTFSPFIYNGKMMLQAILRDVSNRKNRENEVKQQQAIIGSIVNNDLSSVVVVDREFSVILANQTAQKFYSQIKPDFELGRNILDYLNPEDRTEFIDECHLVFKGEKYIQEKEVKIADGIQYVEHYAFPINNDEGEIIGACLSIRDIGERKLRDLENIERNIQIMQSEAAARFGSWSYEIGNAEFVMSQGLLSILRLPADSLQLSFDDFVNQFVLESDRKHLFSLIEKASQSTEPIEMAFRGGIEGETKWFRLYAKRVVDTKTKIIRISGLIQDITQAQRAATEIEKSYTDLQKIQDELELSVLRSNQILQTAHEAVVAIDKSYHITSFNEKFAQYVQQIDKVPVINAHFMEFILPVEQELFQQWLKGVFEEGKSTSVDRHFTNPVTDKTEYFKTHFAPILDSYGAVLEAMIFFTPFDTIEINDENFAEVAQRMNDLERKALNDQKLIKDLTTEQKLLQKKLTEFRDKENSLLQLLQLKEDEIESLKK